MTSGQRKTAVTSIRGIQLDATRRSLNPSFPGRASVSLSSALRAPRWRCQRSLF